MRRREADFLIVVGGDCTNIGHLLLVLNRTSHTIKCALAAATALSIPLRIAVGLLPATMFRRPSLKMARARTVAVVVPSPARSLVFCATSMTSLAPMFSNRSSSSISLATVTPSLVTVGPPKFVNDDVTTGWTHRHSDCVGHLFTPASIRDGRSSKVIVLPRKCLQNEIAIKLSEVR